MNNLNLKPILLGMGLFCLTFLTSQNLTAQRQAGDIGIGAQVGQPTGLTVKFYNPRTSFDLLAAWDLDDFIFLNGHAVFDAHLNDRNTVHFFYGPGAFIGIRDREPENVDDDVVIGISGTFGLDVMFNKFELFIQGTPRLSLIEATDFDMGGGAGFRFYF